MRQILRKNSERLDLMKVSDWSKYDPYFKKEEFDCRHTGLNEMQIQFMDKILELRQRYGKPMIVSSGYRHWTNPTEARKNHKNGEHTTGNCADFRCSHDEAYWLIKLAFELDFPRIGIHQRPVDNAEFRFVHIGIGALYLPTPRIWSY